MNNLTAITAESLTGYLASHAKLLPNSRKKYKQILTRALNKGVDFTDLHSVIDYAQTLTDSNKRTFRSSLRAWSKGIEIEAKLSATPDNIHAVQAIIWRLEGLNERLESPGNRGDKAHTWLSFQEVIKIYALCGDDTNRCHRDRILFGLMCGAGLRRDELVKLTFDDVIKQPYGDKIRYTLNVDGKGAKKRSVPIRNDMARAIFRWHKVVGDGTVLRSVNKGDSITGPLSGSAISKIVTNVGVKIGYPILAPHDLRRTFAQIAYNNGNGATIDQLRIILGHTSDVTTRKYVKTHIDLERSPCDYTPPVTF
jgi:integrase